MEGDIIEYDCFGGLPKVYTDPFGNNYTKYPYIVQDIGQDSQMPEIVGVEKRYNKYIIKVKYPPYDENQGIKEINVERRGPFFA